MLESDWDKYDLLQIQPKDFDELTASLALSHNPTMNPYIYTYLKIQKVQPFTFSRYSEIEAAKEILKDSHGMLLYKEQADAIIRHIATMSEEDKMEQAMAIKILTREIEKRKGTLSDRTFFRTRALFCYRNAYIKANLNEQFNRFLSETQWIMVINLSTTEKLKEKKRASHKGFARSFLPFYFFNFLIFHATHDVTPSAVAIADRMLIVVWITNFQSSFFFISLVFYLFTFLLLNKNLKKPLPCA